MTDHCLICDRVELWKSGNNPYLICDMANTILVVGDHQYHNGYALLLLKEHIRELHELSPRVQQDKFADLMCAGAAISKAFQPWKINYACLGNAEEHVHWHIFPRYENTPDMRSNPWRHADEFKKHRIDEAEAAIVASKIRNCL